MKGFIVYRTNEEINGKEYVFLYGRLENQESFASMHEFSPYFFIKEKDSKTLKKIDPKKEIILEKTELKSFKQEHLIKLNFKNQKHLSLISKELREFEIETFEEDLKPATRFFIDNNILDYIEIEGIFQKNERVDRFYENPKINPCQGICKPKVLSLDIESGKSNNNLFCIGLYMEDKKEVLMITKNKIKGVVSCKTERECLEKFKERIIELDPDIITGWNVIDFDLVYLKKLFDEHKIPFDIGRNNRSPRLRIEKNFLKKSSIDLPGRIVLDGLNLIRDPFIKEAPTIKNIRFESYALEEVAEQILGKTKLIKGKNRHEKIERLYNGTEKEQEELAKYNLQDCRLVYEILEKTDIVKLSMERASLIGMQIDKLTGSIANFDSLYIRETKKRKLASPSSFFKKKSQKITGGFVIQPKPGVYNNVLVLDFKSLYPSIIRTFNIDPASHLEKREKDCIETPNKAFFKNQEGILPEIIQKLFEARERAKKEKRELSSYAIKIIMNSFFGILASPNSRYFNMEIANSITEFGQEIIKLTARKIEEKGFEVTYGDTDSIFVETNCDKSKAEQLGKSLPFEINKFYKEYIEKEYARKSYLELEFDKLFLSLLIPRTRNVDKEEERGAKKRYAGLIEKDRKEEIVIVGMEAIRGDWTEAAQEFQKEILMMIFKGKDIITFVRDFIKNLKNGALDKKLIYRKSIRKELKEYTKTTPPHVKAARKLKNLESNRIEYYMTSKGPEPIQNLKNPIDYEHYIEKQIKPIAKSILETIGTDPEKAFSDTIQETLF
jgi:DNA polymerase II